MRFFLATFLVLITIGCAQQQPKQPCFIQLGKAKWQTEVAKSEEEREKGLMFRSSMPEENAMIFVFEHPHPVTMWMKNTYISLDMLFVDKNFLINGTKESTTPLSEEIIRSREIASYVLELNAGQIAANQIKVGDTLDISQCPALAEAKKE